jgi:hypothetical protein
VYYSLVSCPRNTRYFAGGQLAVFPGASEAPISVGLIQTPMEVDAQESVKSYNRIFQQS